MKCPFCNYYDTKVIDTRSQNDGTTIKRRRLCEDCSKRFTTFERADDIHIKVIKRTGVREIFDRDKLLGGIIKSCSKRPVTIEQMEKIVDEVENAIINTVEKEIASDVIGNIIMDSLKFIDDVAYVRFASVYKQFEDINSFMDELKKMEKDKK